MATNTRSGRFSRRDALRMLSTAAAATTYSKFASAAAPEFPKGAIIRTVLKDYAPEDLGSGATLFHEHMSLPGDFNIRWADYARQTREANGETPVGAGGAARPPENAPSGAYFMRDADFMTEEMRQAKADGIACIVDGGHADMGRDLNFLKMVSQKSGLPIVAGGGFYAQVFYPKEISTWSENQIYDALLKQVESELIGAFGEIGSWDYITADERKVFRAIGRAQAATNLPVFTHTGIPGKSAIEQLDILEDSGAKPQHIVIGHLGNLVDAKVQIQKQLCRRGCFVGFDRQGGQGDAQQVPMVMALIEAGFAQNLLLSSDFSAFRQTKQGGGAGYAKTLTVFVPKLKEAGASDDVLQTIMVDNPRRFLAFVPKKPRRA
jgi:phosphotriesterase-related protein